MAMLGEKLGGGPVDHSVGLGVVSGELFLKSIRVHPTLTMAYGRLPCTRTACRKRTPDIHGLAWEAYALC
jgi:hypothetical protein